MSTVKDYMTTEPACCSPDTELREVAQMMVDCDCGEIPVLDSGRKVVGVITDRDIACRVVARGRNPSKLTARECMSDHIVTVKEDASFDECVDLMEDNKVRRLPVVDQEGRCCGIISQADVIRNKDFSAGEVIRRLSRPSDTPSAVAS
ncbi:MAG: CBS domain-containing protein [Halobacteriovoraceae bacterium]|nr:CBS domain-containing protein [Halobacteriovoraceae bacterium]|tara:strand:+ start:64951 stop:65394 length:444 start_codon:yes stop_codon:yes gene_type:complete